MILALTTIGKTDTLNLDNYQSEIVSGTKSGYDFFMFSILFVENQINISVREPEIANSEILKILSVCFTFSAISKRSLFFGKACEK